jgi:hypothetical protein
LSLDFTVYLPEPNVVPKEVENVVELFGNVDRFVVGFKFILSDLGHLKNVMSGKGQLLKTNTDHLVGLFHLHVIFSSIVEAVNLVRHTFVKLNESVQWRKEVVSDCADEDARELFRGLCFRKFIVD